MERYQIKIMDADLTDMIHEIATQVVTQVTVASEGAIRDLKLYGWVFQDSKAILKKYVRGFHVCGCRPHCDVESLKTELSNPAVPAQELGRVNPRSGQINRYVLMLEIPLTRFAKEVEIKILRTVAEHTSVRNWHKKLFPLIQASVERTLGRYLYYSPSCNRGEYLCEVGECTEFDPWERVQPR